MDDWGAGRYEHIAAGLAPAAHAVVRCAAPGPGEHLLDIGCGTGNASIIAALSGTHVTGVDPSERLLEAATDRAYARHLSINFIPGEAAALPVRTGQADVVISVFGVVFADDAAAAISEIGRVTASNGRVVLCTWIPEGALFDLARIRRDALAAANGHRQAPPRFPWHDPHALRREFERHGFALELHEDQLAFTAGTPREFLERELRAHPLWVTARSVLEPRSEWDAVRDKALRSLETANETGDGFRVTSRFAIICARRP